MRSHLMGCGRSLYPRIQQTSCCTRIEEVKQQTENDDDTEHQHVLASPLYLLWLCCYLVTLVTASTTVLCCQDESVNDVTNCQSCQTQSCNYGVPVSTQQFADCVVSFSRESATTFMQPWNVKNRIRAIPVTDITTFLPIDELINHIND